ncbi:MAG: hypothetical protein AB8H86_26335 [Polyangiales bacterium]
MAKPPVEYNLVHEDGREERVEVFAKTVRVAQLEGGEVVGETEQVHRFAPQAREAAKAYVWNARERGFLERAPHADPPPAEPAQPTMLIRYRVTKTGGVTTTYLQDGRRLRSNDAIQEFESEEEASFALERMIRPAENKTIDKENVSRDEAGLSGLPLTDMFIENAILYEHSEADGRATVQFRESAKDPARYAPLIASLGQSRATTLLLTCEDHDSPKDAWAAALGGTKLPFTNLAFDTQWESLSEQQEHSLGDLSLTLASVPKVERMFISGGITTSPLSHANLRELYLLGDPLHASVLDALGRSTLPALQKLVLCVRQEGVAEDDALILKALRGLDAPALSVVCLYGTSEAIKTAAQLANENPSVRALAVDGPITDGQLESLTEAELGPLSTLAYLEFAFEGFEPPPVISERVPRLHTLNPNRILPTEYQSW